MNSTVRVLDDTDRAIINRLQHGVPVTEKPFDAVAGELGISEGALLARLRAMRDEGLLSRFAPMYHAERLGGAFCLCALSAPLDRFDEIAGIVNGFEEVAHNYRREHELNMWFVLATEDAARIGPVIEEIQAATRLTVYDFPKLDEYFVRLHLEA